MHTLAPDGVKLAVEASGEGKPVSVFGHGLTGSRNDMRLITQFLPGTKVLFDFRGHGESDLPRPSSYSTGHFAADLDAVARDHGATCAGGRCQPVVLCQTSDTTSNAQKLVVDSGTAYWTATVTSTSPETPAAKPY